MRLTMCEPRLESILCSQKHLKNLERKSWKTVFLGSHRASDLLGWLQAIPQFFERRVSSLLIERLSHLPASVLH